MKSLTLVAAFALALAYGTHAGAAAREADDWSRADAHLRCAGLATWIDDDVLSSRHLRAAYVLRIRHLLKIDAVDGMQLIDGNDIKAILTAGIAYRLGWDANRAFEQAGQEVKGRSEPSKDAARYLYNKQNCLLLLDTK